MIILNVFLCMALACGCGKSAGSGNVLTEIRNADNFYMLKVSGIQELEIIESDDYRVVVTADDNVISKVLTYSRSGNLVIENRSNLLSTNISVKVEMPTIRLLDVQGRVDVKCDSRFDVNDMDMRLEGSGHINLRDIQCNGKLTLYTKGSGTVMIGGKANQLKMKVEGSGSVFAEGVATPDIQAVMMGPGSVFVTANGKLSVRLNGAGSLFYSGNPTDINKQIQGTGSVQPR